LLNREGDCDGGVASGSCSGRGDQLNRGDRNMVLYRYSS
jgi:hypothetical protein